MYKQILEEKGITITVTRSILTFVDEKEVNIMKVLFNDKPIYVVMLKNEEATLERACEDYYKEYHNV